MVVTAVVRFSNQPDETLTGSEHAIRSKAASLIRESNVVSITFNSPAGFDSLLIAQEARKYTKIEYIRTFRRLYGDKYGLRESKEAIEQLFPEFRPIGNTPPQC